MRKLATPARYICGEAVPPVRLGPLHVAFVLAGVLTAFTNVAPDLALWIDAIRYVHVSLPCLPFALQVGPLATGRVFARAPEPLPAALEIHTRAPPDAPEQRADPMSPMLQDRPPSETQIAFGRAVETDARAKIVLAPATQSASRHHPSFGGHS